MNIGSLNAIRIIGTGFDATPQNNLISIGNVPCSVVSSTSSLIVCAAGQNPIGTFNFTISVSNTGLAVMNANPTVSFTLTASSLSPTSSGTGGTYAYIYNKITWLLKKLFK